jgi:hypothetical protein
MLLVFCTTQNNPPPPKKGAETMNIFSIYTYWIMATTVYTVIFIKTPAMGDGLHELLKQTYANLNATCKR